jgi:hypothetical protein
MNSTGGTTNPAPGIHIYVNGTEVSVTATPDAYYMLDYWLRDGNNAGLANPATVLMTDDHAIQPVFAKINYTLKIETPTGGNTNPAPGTHTYPAGTTVEVTATQDAGYRFDHWGLGGASAGSANPISISMDTNHRLEAVFIETHTLTITSSGDGTTNPPPGTYTYGVPTNVTVTALPNTSYLFDHWELDSANTGTTNPYTVTMSCNHTLNAMFARVNYTLILSTTAGGSICPVPGSYTYAKGSIVQINETASAGYQFDHWTLDGTNAGSNSSLNVLVDNDHTLQATFARIVKLTITSATGGTTTPSAGVYSYMQGTSAQVNASPNANYVLTGWLLDGAQVNVTGQITVLMDSNHTLQPTFALLNFTLTVSATSGGTTNPTPGTRTYVNGTSVLVSATASSGYGFDHWVLDGIGAGSTPSISVLVNNNHTLQATFARIVKLTITAATGGKTIPSAGVYNYLQGSSAQVNASPNANYVLTGWLKDKVKVNVPGQITILMDSNHAVQPIFTQITFTLTISATAGGTTNPTPGTRTYVNGTRVSVSATARPGYAFDHWTLDGANAGTSRTISVLITCSHTLQATFVKIVQLTIRSSTGGKTTPSAGVYNYLQGSSAQVNVSLNANYLFAGWLLDGVKVNVTGNITIQMNSGHTVQPTFTLLTFTLTVSAASGGTTSPKPGTYTYTNGSSASVTASPRTGYAFDHWVLDSVNSSTSSSKTVVMTQNHALQAVFTPAGTVTVTVKNGSTAVPNANIYLDETYVGATNSRGTLVISRVPVGQHIVNMAKPSYTNATQTVTVTQNANVNVALTTSLQTYTVTMLVTDSRGNTISDANVYMDGVLQGATNATGKLVITGRPFGTHTVRVTNANYRNMTATISVAADLTTAITMTTNPRTPLVLPSFSFYT